MNLLDWCACVFGYQQLRSSNIYHDTFFIFKTLVHSIKLSIIYYRKQHARGMGTSGNYTYQHT